MKKYLFIILVVLGAACISSEDPGPIILPVPVFVEPPLELDTVWFQTDTTKPGDQFNIMVVDYLGYADSAYYDPGPYKLDCLYFIGANRLHAQITDDQDIYKRSVTINWLDSTWQGRLRTRRRRGSFENPPPVVLDSGYLIIQK